MRRFPGCLRSLHDATFGLYTLVGMPCRAARIAFWALIVLGAALVAHAALVLLTCYVFRRHPPACLEFPRLELFMGMFMIQPAAQCAACVRA